MLLHKLDNSFDDELYITELKLDGVRILVSKFNNTIKVFTRNKNEVTNRYPELQHINIPEGTVLDGEIVVTDEFGKPDFEACMERFMSNKSEHKIQYCVFDVIYYQGEKVSHLPLIERKEIIDSIITPDEFITNVQWMYGNGNAYFHLIKQNELEGIVLKKANSKYQIGKRSRDWLKVINYQYTDAFITGLRKDMFGLLLGIDEGSKFKAAGIMEFVSPDARKQFYHQYKDLIIEEDKKFIYLDPKIKCRVKFRNYTKAGLLRIPSFVEYIS